jgi:triacylglycerol lipase
MPHPFLAMDGVLQQGRDTITFIVEALKEVFA